MPTMTRVESDRAAAPTEQFVRFSFSQRTEHLLLIVSFTVLVLTGVPQKFFGSGWAQNLIMTMGGIETTRLVHRTFAVLFCLEGVYHASCILAAVARGRFTAYIIPSLKDVRDAMACFKYCLAAASTLPRFDRFDYRQKFEYWWVVICWMIMSATGLVLMFPTQATQLLPGAFVPASKEMHGGEALLGFLLVVTWHLYGAHFNPLRFPGDLSIFTGKISRERMMREHPLEHARLVGHSSEDEELPAH